MKHRADDQRPVVAPAMAATIIKTDSHIFFRSGTRKGLLAKGAQPFVAAKLLTSSLGPCTSSTSPVRKGVLRRRVRERILCLEMASKLIRNRLRI